MKIRYILSQLFLLSSIWAFSQSPTTIYTCKSGAVAAIINPEYSQSQITYYNNYTMSTYSYLGITFVDNSSQQFNCHSYAWHLREGNSNKVWINNVSQQNGSCYDQSHNLDKYWTDGCFIQVCNEADADKLHYYCGDHSAVKSTTNAGLYESKWGSLAVVRHTRTGVPYSDPVNSVNFYASTAIAGSTSTLCSGTRTFSVKSISGATYAWTTSNGLSVIGASNSNTLSVQPSGGMSGSNWVQVQISTPCSSIPAIRTIAFNVGSPQISIPMTNQGCSGEYQYWYLNATPTTAGSNWSWSVNYLGTNSQINIYNPSSPSTTVSVKGGGTVRLNYTDACGVTRSDGITVWSSCYSYPYRVSISPNPVKGNININIGTAGNEKLSSDPTTAKIPPIKILESKGKTIISLFEVTTNTLTKQWTRFEATNKNYNFNTNGIRKGIYVLQVDRDNQTTITKIIIE